VSEDFLVLLEGVGTFILSFLISDKEEVRAKAVHKQQKQKGKKVGSWRREERMVY
jgi:hypothetical protein